MEKRLIGQYIAAQGQGQRTYFLKHKYIKKISRQVAKDAKNAKFLSENTQFYSGFSL